MLAGVLAETFIPGEQPCSSERGHLDGERDHGLAVVIEVAGIALAVAVDVGAGGIFGIRPEIVRLREVVVWTARAAVRWIGRNSADGQGQVGIGGFEDALAICTRDELIGGVFAVHGGLSPGWNVGGNGCDTERST